MRHASYHHGRKRSGVVLLAVLMIVVILSLVAYQYSLWIMAESAAVDGQVRTTQARLLADSGVHYAAAVLSNPESFNTVLGGNPYDNPTAFQGVAIPSAMDPKATERSGMFSLLGIGPGLPYQQQQTGVGGVPLRFGVSDECGKINVNALLRLDRGRGDRAEEVLLKLPNMTQDVAAAIVDWIDTNSDARTGGAESEYYGTLSPPYRVKNGPLDSLEELLLVRGVTPQLLFGNDINRNGILDPGEDDGTGFPHQGWSMYLTVYSRELNVDNEGNQRINLQERDLSVLAEKLKPAVGQELADYIIAYRRFGGSRVSGGRTRRRFRSIFDLVGSQVRVSSGGGSSTLPSPLNDPNKQRDLLPKLLDKTTISTRAELAPRVNVSTAPLEVLLAIPRLEASDAQLIANAQPPLANLVGGEPLYRTIAWLLTDARLPPDVIRRIEPYITGRSQVYRVQSVGYFPNGGPMGRVEAVIDTNNGRPRIVYWRDLSRLGRAFDPAQLVPSQ